ncbi:MAG: CoA pyrophosphatase [Pseudomonadota bacterium]
MTKAKFTLDEFRHRAWQAQSDVPQVETGDFRFNPDLEETIRNGAQREAAVLIGVLEGAKGPSVLLTERTAKLRSHSGQIAFPGGRVDDTDRTYAETALRECEEEVGIGGEHLEIVGEMPVYFTGSGYRIHPVLAVISGDYTLRANDDEVASIFDVPLSFLMDEGNHLKNSREWQGKKRYFYEMPYGERYIWGVTAGILRVMFERLYR